MADAAATTTTTSAADAARREDLAERARAMLYYHLGLNEETDVARQAEADARASASKRSHHAHQASKSVPKHSGSSMRRSRQVSQPRRHNNVTYHFGHGKK